MITKEHLLLNGFERKPDWDFGNRKKKSMREVFIKDIGDSSIKAYIAGDVCTFGLMQGKDSPYCIKHSFAGDFEVMNKKIEQWKSLQK